MGEGEKSGCEGCGGECASDVGVKCGWEKEVVAV